MKNSSHVSQGTRRAEGWQDRCEVDVVHLAAVRAARATLPGERALSEAAELLGVLANPTRLKLVLALRPEAITPPVELCVCDLSVVAGASTSMTSHQLRLLRTSGLVRQRRAGKLVYYRLTATPFLPLLADVARLVRARDRAGAGAAPYSRAARRPQ